MVSVAILGGGNVSFRLSKALSNNSEIILNQIYSRSKLSFHFDSVPVEKIQDLNLLKEADVYIISVSDDAVVSLAEKLPIKNKLVVHTAGSINMNQLPLNNRKGVFYPLQTFSKSKEVDFQKIPICIEAESLNDLDTLRQLAESISNSVYEIDSDQRRIIHLSACFTNNFTNHLFYIAQKLGEEKQIPFEIFHPLIQETIEKLNVLSPYDAQTGPAKRNDLKTIEKHLELLENTGFKEIYELMTQSIKQTYE